MTKVSSKALTTLQTSWIHCTVSKKPFLLFWCIISFTLKCKHVTWK